MGLACWDVAKRAVLGADGLGEQRQMELEAGAVRACSVGHQQVAGLAAGELAGDVQAEPDPAGLAGGASIELGEALVDALAVAGWDAWPVLLDREHRGSAIAGGDDVDGMPSGSICRRCRSGCRGPARSRLGGPYGSGTSAWITTARSDGGHGPRLQHGGPARRRPVRCAAAAGA